MPTIMEKDEALRIIVQMPQNTTWDDLIREMYVGETIERSLADSHARRTKNVKEIRAKFNLPE